MTKTTAFEMVKGLLASGVNPKYIKLLSELTDAQRKELGL